MTFENSFTLGNQMEQARQQYRAEADRLDAIDAILEKHMNGNTQVGLLGSILGSLAWVAIYLFGCLLLLAMGDTGLTNITPAVTGTLMLCMIFNTLRRNKYYGAILHTRHRLAELKSRIQQAEGALSANLHTYLSCRGSQWSCTLTPGDSIAGEAAKMEQTALTMEALDGGLLMGLQTGLYYLTCAAWTVAGIYGLQDTFRTFVCNYVSYETADTLLVLGTIVILVLDLLFARFLWSRTGCTVTNLTLLATIAGPFAFVAMTLVIALAIGILYFVFQLIVGLIAVVIGGSLLLGLLSGGG